MTNTPTPEDYKKALDFIFTGGEYGYGRTGTHEDAYHCFKYHGEVIRSALTLAASDTHVWVPRKATLHMRDMGAEGIPRPCNWFDIHHADEVWDAMITAAEGK